MSDEERPDKTGYKSPPKQHQFKKGQSGNPKGRPSGSKNFGMLFVEGLNEEVVIHENGQPRKITVQEAIVKRTYLDAMKGKDKAREKIFSLFSDQFKKEYMTGRSITEDDLDKLTIEELKQLDRILRKLEAPKVNEKR